MKKVILTEAKFRKLLNEIRFNKDMIFVSYLYDEFNKDAMTEPKEDSFRNKFTGGLWACPIDSVEGWKEWCEHEDFHTGNNQFTFKLKPEAKIYEIDNAEDLIRVSTLLNNKSGRKRISLEYLRSNGYDGIYATENAVMGLRYYERENRDIEDLYNWDVESLFIFNPDVIIPISNERVQFNYPNYDDYYDY
jgi:hypothetical protein